MCLRNSSCKCPDCTGVTITAADLLKAGAIFEDRFGDAAAAGSGAAPAAPAVSTSTSNQEEKEGQDTLSITPAPDGPPTVADPGTTEAPSGSATASGDAATQNAGFDDTEIPGSGAGMYSVPQPGEQPESSAPQKDGDERPLLERLADKKLKLADRRAAYGEFVAFLDKWDGSRDLSGEIVAALHRIVTDSNMVAMGVGLPAVSKFLQVTKSAYMNMLVTEVLPGLVSSSFSQGRASVVDAARVGIWFDLVNVFSSSRFAIVPLTPLTRCGRARWLAPQNSVLTMMEFGAVEPVTTALLNGLKHKKPKVPPVCLNTLAEAIYSFGVPAVDPKPLLAALPSCFQHVRAPVRQAAGVVALELYRCVVCSQHWRLLVT